MRQSGGVGERRRLINLKRRAAERHTEERERRRGIGSAVLGLPNLNAKHAFLDIFFYKTRFLVSTNSVILSYITSATYNQFNYLVAHFIHFTLLPRLETFNYYLNASICT